MTPVSSLVRRTGAAALGGVLVVGLLAGCGGSDDSKKKSEEPSASASVTESTDATEPTEPASTGYLPVPTGVTLTEPGAALQFGDTATVAWRPRQDRVVALDLTVERIDKTSFKESFEGWVVTDQMKGQIPFFVRVKAKNVSDADVGGLLVPLYAFAGVSSMYEPLSFRDEEFEPCPGGVLPDKLMPGESADLCFVYLLPEGVVLRSAAFDLVGELEPVTWSGKVTAIEKPKKDKDKKKPKKDDEQTG
ncbi:hypothetical protein F0U44_16015 [Nocardioides humilatus]|uniref:Cyclic nucleotide-binding domain-containing protein n=1 Tax=Nocardioides humilatus TaxID=2607660 RepID=A0A5B1LAV4_9ACTN|nr:hypothetical protein [Nocardioides humilatus]KAA1417792.1 hypothetical protein F0U44_16015 [Nocardioides humilatus]